MPNLRVPSSECQRGGQPSSFGALTFRRLLPDCPGGPPVIKDRQGQGSSGTGRTDPPCGPLRKLPSPGHSSVPWSGQLRAGWAELGRQRSVARPGTSGRLAGGERASGRAPGSPTPAQGRSVGIRGGFRAALKSNKRVWRARSLSPVSACADWPQ